MITICLIKLIPTLLNYKVKDIFYNKFNHRMFVGKSQMNYISI